MEGREGWSADLANHTGYEKEELRDIVMKIGERVVEGKGALAALAIHP